MTHDVPVVSGPSAGYRVSALLGYLRAVHYDRLRQALVKTSVYSIHREHPDAVEIEAILKSATLPDPFEYRAGRRKFSYKRAYAYSFRIQPRSHPVETQEYLI